MKRITLGVILSLILILLLSSLSFSTIGEEKTGSKTIYVDDSGGADYTSIQDAIDNASDGDTIFVYNGTYYGNLDIDESINLVGESNKNTIIKTKGDGDINPSILFPWYFNVTGEIWCHSSVSINGFRFDDFCLELLKSNNTIFDNIFNSSSILIYGADNIISNNIIINNTDDMGLIVFEPRSNISGNIFENNRYGLLLTQDGHVVSNNVFSQNEYGFLLYPFSGLMWYEKPSGNVIVMKNLFIDNTCGLYLFRYLLHLAFWSHINYNNFIGNNQHARFLVNIFPFKTAISVKYFPLIKTERMDTRWRNNYWDDYIGVGIKIIPGKIGILCLSENIDTIPPNLDDFWSPVFAPFFGGIPFVNFDWHPAKEPFDIQIDDF
jgi:nitrous oxidase accessory protein NosD